MPPQFTHDCDWCIFIGRVERGHSTWIEGSRWGRDERPVTWPKGDLWLCPGGAVIVRTGDDGWEYSSLGDAYLNALPAAWRPIARSIWRHTSKPDEYDREQMRKRRTERRQDRRIRRRGDDPFLMRMSNLPLIDCE